MLLDVLAREVDQLRNLISEALDERLQLLGELISALSHGEG